MDTTTRSNLQRPVLDTQKLNHFLAVFELRNFARAAEAVGVTQQAISKSIRRLESQLGVTLFDRGAFGAEPTAFGRSLARRARTILGEARLASAELAALRGSDEGFVRIGFGWTFLPHIAPLTIKRFTQRRPNVTVSVVTGESRKLFRGLLDGDIDLVASAPHPELVIDPNLQTRKLFDDKDVVVMSARHPLARGGQPSLEDLSKQAWLVSLSLTEQWNQIAGVFLAHNIEPPTAIIDVDSIILAKALIRETNAVALLSRELVAEEESRGEFALFENAEFPSVRAALITVRKKSDLPPAANAFRADLNAVCRQLV